jgi:gliding motility-associated protein GldM
MSGGNCPETPRQKMIGMMYLFYTALMALNVSNEVLNAFVAVNAGIDQTIKNFTVKTQSLYSEIDKKAAANPGKYDVLQKEAKEFEQRCNNLVDSIRLVKVMCLNKSDETIDPTNIDNDTCVIKKMDDINAAPAVMDPEAGGEMGTKLRASIDAFRTYVMGMSVFKDSLGRVDTTSVIYKNTMSSLQTPDKIDDGATIPWEIGLVRHMPLVGTLALLSKLQSDIRNVEAEVVQKMVADLEGLDIRISSLTGLVSTSKSVVMSGSQYEADIFIGARDTTMKPTIYITQTAPYYDSVKLDNGTYRYMKLANATYDTLPIDAEGRGHYVTSAGPGEHPYGGLIYWKANTGDQWIPYKSSYAVATSSTTISATACNIFYKGLQNPLSVAASGYTNINVTATGGATITKGKVAGYEGEYIVTIPSGTQTKEVTINVSADGKSVGHQTFKVMNVPSPIITIGGYKSGDDVPKAAIKGSPRLDAVLEGGFFPFKDVKYTVTSFTYMKEVRGVTSSQVVSGNTIPGDILSDISKKASGSSISFIGIKVSSPSGPRNAPGFAARLK